MFTMRNIIREGHKSLTTKSKDVSFPLNEGDIKLGLDLLEFVQNSQDEVISQKYHLRPGVGLAAVQVNQLKRMFALYFNDFDGTLYRYIVINPVITKRSVEMTYLPGGEGCLSVDRETDGLTPRHFEIEVSFMSLDPLTKLVKPVSLTLSGYPAVVFQHEFDHLEGIMFTTKLFDQLPYAQPLFELSDDALDENDD